MSRLLLPFDKDVWTHLRLPFSFFLLPVFLFGISQSSNIHAIGTLISFIVMHLFIYPGSNAYNSYMDQDTGPIGGLEHPPPATPQLYYASIWIDIAGLLLCLVVGWQLMLLAAGYIAFSKSYSWHGIRFKKYAITGWALVAFFQGGYTYILAGMAASGIYTTSWFTQQQVIAMTIATILIGAYYPLTQIYQHAEDGGRGDRTISVLLGIRGTMLFSAILFALSFGLAAYYFLIYFSLVHLGVFLGCLLPVVIYFLVWWSRIVRNPANADYRHAMLMTRLSATCTVICFLILTFLNQRAVF